MMDLSLRGSQISLSRQSASSARNSSRTCGGNRSRLPSARKDTQSNSQVCSEKPSHSAPNTEVDHGDSQTHVKEWLNAYVTKEVNVSRPLSSTETRKPRKKIAQTGRKQTKHCEQEKESTSTLQSHITHEHDDIYMEPNSLETGRNMLRYSISQEHIQDYNIIPPPVYQPDILRDSPLLSNDEEAEVHDCKLNNESSKIDQRTDAARIIQLYWRNHKKRYKDAQNNFNKLMQGSQSLQSNTNNSWCAQIENQEAEDNQGNKCPELDSLENNKEDILHGNTIRENENQYEIGRAESIESTRDLQFPEPSNQININNINVEQFANTDTLEEEFEESANIFEKKPKDWAEMIKEINRVLSEPEETVTTEEHLASWPSAPMDNRQINVNTNHTQEYNTNIPDHWPVTENYGKYSGHIVEHNKSHSKQCRLPKQAVGYQCLDSESMKRNTKVNTSSERKPRNREPLIKVNAKVDSYRKDMRENSKTTSQWKNHESETDRNFDLTEPESMSLQLEEKCNALNRLQRVLEHQRRLFKRQLEEAQVEATKRIESLKVDYDATLSKNYQLIDELIEEKKVLHEKCEKLLTELKTVTKKAEDKLKIAEDNYRVNLRKTEAKLIATEKLKREKWEAEKARQLKEITVRGVEGEVSKLISNHQMELQNLRQECDNRIKAADEIAFEKYQRQLETTRQTLIREKDEACAREREIFNKRLEQALIDERAVLEKQRSRLLQEISDERERIMLVAKREREELERSRRVLEESYKSAKQIHDGELVRIRTELENKHKNEIEAIERRCELERSQAEEALKRELKEHYLSQETEMRESLKRERDLQLEDAIRRLEQETVAVREESDRESAIKLKRMREKFESEIQQMEDSEKKIMEKYNKTKAQLLELAEEKERITFQLKQDKQELEHSRSFCNKLMEERQNVSEVVRQEYADRLVSMEQENAALKRQLADLKARLSLEQSKHETEMKDLKAASALELESLHQKIQQALNRKEMKIAHLRQQFSDALCEQQKEVANANRRAEHLEELLDQQSKQLLQTGQ